MFKFDLSSLTQLDGTFLKRPPVKAPDGFLSGNPDLQPRLNELRSVHLLIQHETPYYIGPR